MAISVNTVYKTVLSILNKEQRGYMTPDEFNKIVNHVQLEIFEKYFEDLNQMVRQPQNDADYADRLDYLEEKIAIHNTTAPGTGNPGNSFALAGLHILGTISYNGSEAQRVSKKEFYNINKSPLTKPTEGYPIYTLDSGEITVYPKTIVNTSLEVSFIQKPTEAAWKFTVDANTGVFIESNSANIDLHDSEQSEVILKVLMYAGVVIKDMEIVQIASARVKQEEVNQKS
tara:strand:+ start:57 stop:743 length:687 start_codon:yes stop_codon:yes gene_type:complete